MKWQKGMRGIWLTLAVAALALPVSAQVVTTETVCRDGYVYRERCAEIDGEQVCTLDPVQNLAVGAQVTGCSDLKVLETFAMLATVQGLDLASTEFGGQQGLVELNPVIGNDPETGRPNIGRLVAVKIAAIAAGTLNVHLIAKKNPRLAKQVRRATVIAMSAVAIKNTIGALQERKKRTESPSAATAWAPPLSVTVSW